jgi:hypothetical protein
MPLRLIYSASFDADTTKLMGEAYEQACEGLSHDDVSAREGVAKRIIEAAKRGERSLTRLVECGRGLNRGAQEAS